MFQVSKRVHTQPNELWIDACPLPEVLGIKYLKTQHHKSGMNLCLLNIQLCSWCLWRDKTRADSCWMLEFGTWCRRNGPNIIKDNDANWRIARILFSFYAVMIIKCVFAVVTEAATLFSGWSSKINVNNFLWANERAARKYRKWNKHKQILYFFAMLLLGTCLDLTWAGFMCVHVTSPH